jgi:hypothetical protein
MSQGHDSDRPDHRHRQLPVPVFPPELPPESSHVAAHGMPLNHLQNGLLQLTGKQ